jgi:hypothetical protein
MPEMLKVGDRAVARGMGKGAPSVDKLDGSSKRQRRNLLYDRVIRYATPGDVVFFVSDRKEATAFSPLSRIYRRWLGFSFSDTTLWHTALYTGPVKETGSSTIRPHIIHAHTGGVEEEHLRPSLFTSVRSEKGAVEQSVRIEIMHNPGLTLAQRTTIVEYCRSQLGKPFDDRGWRHDFLTYTFGLPSRRQDPNKASCHGMVYLAYEKAGVTFPHQLASVPIFNLARYLGHPLGHPAACADPSRLYLRDHHLYRDPRFRTVLALFDDTETGEPIVALNPGKYSWQQDIREYDCWRFPAL